MNIDFHYFAVKTLALKAGFSKEDAQTIAVFSQYIDDYNAYSYRNYTNIPQVLKNTERYDLYLGIPGCNFNPPTTGFVDDVDTILCALPRQQRYTISPFHFIPRKKEEIVKEDYAASEAEVGDGSFISDCLIKARTQYQNAEPSEKTNCLMKMGMLIHTFADTCAHQKFNGYHDKKTNDAVIISIYDNIEKREIGSDEFQKYMGTSFSPDVIPAIGHGTVGHIPDLPYIKWKMRKTVTSEVYERDNTEAYIGMCKKILNYFRACRNLEVVPDDEWSGLSSHLKGAFLNKVRDPNKEYEEDKKFWSDSFPNYKDEYYYSADQVLSGARNSYLGNMEEKYYVFAQYVEDYLIELYGAPPRRDEDPISGVCEFTCSKLGENSHAVSETGLCPGAAVSINEKTDLSDVIRFNDGGCVYGISLVENKGTNRGIYQYKIQVDGRGPKGAFSGNGYLYFTDATGDTYTLTIFRSERDKHIVQFNSRDPRITTITWSNYSR